MVPSTKGLRLWLFVSVLLWAVLGWSLYDQLPWSPGGTPEEVGRHLQHHPRLMKYFIGVFAGVGLCGMTRWVYWALYRALDPAWYEVCAIQPSDAQALGDFCTRREAEDDADAWEASWPLRRLRSQGGHTVPRQA
jgi:hypothetical protein